MPGYVLLSIALASLETEPAIHRWRRETVEPYGPYPWHYGNFIGFSKPVEGIEDEYFYSAPPAPVVPAELHPDTQKLVTDFCTALAEKLYKAQLKYGYDADWKQDGWPTQCQAHFHQHIAKGDPRDVAAYCAFMWYHGWKTEPAPALVSVPDDVMAAIQRVARIRLDLNDFDGDKRGIAESLGEAEEALIEVVNRRAAMLQGAELVTTANKLPDGWVACSERMPPPKTGVIVGCWFGRNWATKWATYLPYHPDAHQSGFLMPGGSWTPTHWMPLPAAPQQEVK